MDARIAAELLYESEATLRMVDTVLDELCIDEHDARDEGGSMRLETSGAAGVHSPSEFCVRGYWQVQELLECIKQAREMVSPEGQTELALGAAPDRDRLDSILSLVDSLESLGDHRSEQGANMLHTLREELHRLLGHSGSDARGNVTNLLAEAEAGLTRLGHFFEDADAA